MSSEQILVCMPVGSWSPFVDNLIGKCSECGCDVIYRPHAPPDARKVCTACISGVIGIGPFSVGITDETREELKAWND